VSRKDGKPQNKIEWERRRKEGEKNEQIQNGSEMDGKPQEKTEYKRQTKEAETNRRADTE
jgi:hypothetical protein